MVFAISVARIVVAFDGINLAWRGWINMVISQDLVDYFFFASQFWRGTRSRLDEHTKSSVLVWSTAISFTCMLHCGGRCDCA